MALLSRRISRHDLEGRTLWILILIKLFVMFAILRLFFFQPQLGGLTDEQKSETVGAELLR